MKYAMVIGWVMSGVSFISAANNCALDKDTLIANYQETIKHGGDNDDIQKEFTLIRQNNRLFHFYPEQKKATGWFLLSNKKVTLTRLFTDIHRGIEYQPQEITDKQPWFNKKHLLSEALFNKMSLKSSKGQGCDLLMTYSYSHREKNIGYATTLVWQPALALVHSLKVHNEGVITLLKLTSVDNTQATVTAKVKAFDSYKMTDYSDIGDNEADPFLAKMIYQGFSAGVVEKHSDHDEHKH